MKCPYDQSDSPKVAAFKLYEHYLSTFGDARHRINGVNGVNDLGPSIGAVKAWMRVLAKIQIDSPMRPTPEDRQAAFEFAQEMERQYKFLVDWGIQFEFVESDPYPNSEVMFAQFAEHGVLRVLKSDTSPICHPLFSPSDAFPDLLYNDLFRAVHDTWGHAAHSNSFSGWGEYKAYRAHILAMPSTACAQILAGETVAQIGVYHYGHEFGRQKEQFADQKVCRVPIQFMRKDPVLELMHHA